MSSLGQERQVFAGMMDSSIRRYNFPIPGQAVVPHHQMQDPDYMVDDGGGDYDDHYDMQMQDGPDENVSTNSSPAAAAAAVDVVTVEDVEDGDDDDDVGINAAHPGVFDANTPEEGLGIHQILGQDEADILLQPDIELRIRDIVFPRVEIQRSATDHEFITEIIDRVNNHCAKKKIPDDASYPVLDNSHPPSEFKSTAAGGRSAMTVSQFALALNAWAAVHGHSNASTNDLLRILRDGVPGLRLPLKPSDKTPFTDKRITTNTIQQYQQDDFKSFPTDICRRECMAFRGHQFIAKKNATIDCSKLLECAVCGDPRYTKCSHKTCIEKGTEFVCNPFVPKERRKYEPYHAASCRTSMKMVFCRSIIVKLIELYCLSLMKGFEGILDYDNRRVKKDGKIIDVLDGTEVKKQKSKMNTRFRKARKAFKNQAPDLKLIQCSLILTAFYDGVVNFARKADSMWPLMVSVASCNPSHRSKIGVGLFLSILHNVSVGSGAEKYLIEEMFTQELIKLENGVLFTIPAQSGFKERHVFLQARLVFMHLDTKALEKFGCVKMCNSVLGCAFCNSQSGCYRKHICKYTYGNTRVSLHERHVLRPLGQREFTDEPAVFNDEGEFVRQITALDKHDMYYGNAKEYRVYFDRDLLDAGPMYRLPIANNDAVLQELEDKMTLKRSRDWDEQLDTVWYHTDKRFAPHKFLTCARFPFPDRREQRKYKRRSNKDYLRNGKIARLRRSAAEALYRANPRKRPKIAKDFSSCGVHEIAPIIEHTDAFKIHNLGPDSMHLFANANNNFTRVYKGERGLQPGSRELSYSQEKHPSAQYTQCRAEWECDKADQDLIDAIVNGFFVPATCSNDFHIRNPMKQRGFMKSKDHFNYLIAYSSFVMSFTDVVPDYVAFMAMYADDMCHLFDPHLSASSLSLLGKKVMETRSTQEGLFPESEQIFIFHEIVDVVNHIMKFGHVRGLMCYAGERANGEISSCISKGGVNYLLTLFNRYVLKESSALKHFLARDETNYDNRGVYSDFALKLFGKSEIYNQFVESDFNNLYKIVFTFLRTQYLDESILLKRSPFFRLYTAFLFQRRKTGTNDFFTWLKKFSADYQNNDRVFFQSKKRNIHCTQLIYNDSSDSHNNDYLSCINGIVFLSDMIAVAECILPLDTFQLYTNVIVKGMRFKCRGKKFMAKQGEHNELEKSFEWRKHYSCIARVKAYKIEERNEDDTVILRSNNTFVNTTTALRTGHKHVLSHSIQFAWLNCAFRLNIPCDSTIHGLAIGHCALRDGIYVDKRWQHRVRVTGGPTHDKFVCLNYLDSSPIVSSAFNKDGKVLLRRSDLSSFVANSLPNPECYASGETNKLALLYLIPVRPERLSLTYDTVLRDKDHTLVLEKDCNFRVV